jgi:hypothetical protein
VANLTAHDLLKQKFPSRPSERNPHGTSNKKKFEVTVCKDICFLLKYSHSKCILSSTSVPFGPTTTSVQMPNLELVETKRITVYKNKFKKPHFFSCRDHWLHLPPPSYCIYCNIGKAFPCVTERRKTKRK